MAAPIARRGGGGSWDAEAWGAGGEGGGDPLSGSVGAAGAGAGAGGDALAAHIGRLRETRAMLESVERSLVESRRLLARLEHEAQLLTVPQAAKRAGVSDDYLRKVIDNTMGLPARVYVRSAPGAAPYVKWPVLERWLRGDLEIREAAPPTVQVLLRLTDGTVLHVNDAWCEWTGWRREDVLGATSVELGMWPDAETRRAQILDRVEAAGGRPRGELAVLDLPAGRRVVRYSADVVEAAGEVLLQIEAVDVTHGVTPESVEVYRQRKAGKAGKAPKTNKRERERERERDQWQE